MDCLTKQPTGDSDEQRDDAVACRAWGYWHRSGSSGNRACVRKATAFQIVEYEIADPVAFQSYIKGADAIHSARVFLPRHAPGTALSGEPPKKWIGILRYPSLEEALAFDSSPGYTALKPIRDKATKWRSSVVEGLPNQ